MKKNRKKMIIWTLLIFLVLVLLFLYVRPRKVIKEPFEVKYISIEEFERFLVEDMHAQKVDEIDNSNKKCNEYSKDSFTIGEIDVDEYEYLNNSWEGFYCAYYLFDNPSEAKVYFEDKTIRFKDVLIDNEYHSEETEGYCLINACDSFHNDYKGYYWKDNMIIFISHADYAILPFADEHIYVNMNRVCKKLDVPTPLGLKRVNNVRNLFYTAITIAQPNEEAAVKHEINALIDSEEYKAAEIEEKKELVYELLVRLSTEGAGFYNVPLFDLDEVVFKEDRFTVVMIGDDGNPVDLTWSY